MAEEGPGARRLSPHNKDPSLVTSYLPPNLQKAPCHPSKAPAPAACAATRRDGGVAAGPLLCPPACPPPPLGPLSPRMRSEARPQQLGALVVLCRCSPHRVGTPGCPLPVPTSPLYSSAPVHPADSDRRPQPPAEPHPHPRALLRADLHLPASRGRFTSARTAPYGAGTTRHPPRLPGAAGPGGSR